MTEQKLERYSKICNDCAEEEGGVCLKEVVCYNVAECAICKEELSCLSAKDWNLPRPEESEKTHAERLARFQEEDPYADY